MSKSRLFFATSIFIFSSSLCLANDRHMVDLFISGGASFSRIHNDGFVYISDYREDYFDTLKQTQWRGTGGFGISHTFNNFDGWPWDFALGVSAYYVNFGQVEGVGRPVYEYENAYEFDYDFKGQSYSILGEGRLIYAQYCWQPYFIGGVGVGFNRLYDYDSAPRYEHHDSKSDREHHRDYFPSNTYTAFAYELGIGIQRGIYLNRLSNVEVTAAVDYRYMNFGNAKFEKVPGEIDGEGLEVRNMNTQVVMLTLKVSI